MDSFYFWGYTPINCIAQNLPAQAIGKSFIWLLWPFDMSPSMDL